MQLLRLPEGVPVGTAVFQLSLNLEVDPPATDWQLLDGDERVQANSFQQHSDRVRFVCARAGLRRLLGTQLQTKPGRLSFETDQHGKPLLVGRDSTESRIHFNVSHSGAHALIAVSDRWPVGVDIERRDININVAELEEQVFSPLERRAGNASQVTFFDRWTAKEAVLKTLGLGVTEYLQQLSVLAPPEIDAFHQECYHLQYDGIDWPELKACRLPAPEGYAAALAWTEASLRSCHE